MQVRQDCTNIIWYPSHEAFEVAERGEILLGGCELINSMPHEDYGCLECGYR